MIRRSFLLSLVWVAACSRPATSDPAPAAEPKTPAAVAGPRVIFDAVEASAGCLLGHQGLVVDFGEASTPLRLVGRDDPEPETVEREGATWSRHRSRSFGLRFVALGADAAGQPAFVAARARGGAARGAAVYLNGKPVGLWSFGREETRVVVARGGSAQLQPGENELLVRFQGGHGRLADEVRAELDWLHVGSGDPESSFAAPTRSDAVASITVGAVSKRAFALRAPGFARCTTFAPRGARLEVNVALVGNGEGEAEVRWHRDRREAVTLGRSVVSSRAPAGAETGRSIRWTALSLPLPEPEGDGDLGVLELVSRRAPRGARVVFGEPRLVLDGETAAAPVAPAPPVRGALLVVLGSTAPRSLALYGGPRTTPELASLAVQGTVFEGHRAAAGFAAGALASMLTGRAPLHHGLVDMDARLPARVTTVAEAARQAGLATAYFTANPGTTAAFGFARGWDHFAAYPPMPDVPAVRAFDDLATWLSERREGRFLAVLHARGVHPPWDVSQEELRLAPPPNYVGSVDPRNAAGLLTHARRGGPRRTDADQTRLLALEGLAAQAQDAALGRVLAALRAAGRDGDTAIIVTGDVGASDTSPAPFAEGDPTDEASLAVPLLVALPGPARVGKRVRLPTTGVDIALTLMDALRLAPPDGFQGRSLLPLARGEGATPEPTFTGGARRSIVRWGHLVYFAGHTGSDEKLCDTLLEPACLTDVQSTYPLALDALRQLLRRARTGEGTRAAPLREAATIDQATSAGLKAWGR